MRQVVAEFPRIDMLVNNAAEQHLCEDFADIPADQVVHTLPRCQLLPQGKLGDFVLSFKNVLNSSDVNGFVTCTLANTCSRDEPTILASTYPPPDDGSAAPLK